MLCRSYSSNTSNKLHWVWSSTESNLIKNRKHDKHRLSVPVSKTCVREEPDEQLKQDVTVRNPALMGAAVSFSHTTLKTNYPRLETQVLNPVFCVSFVLLRLNKSFWHSYCLSDPVASDLSAKSKFRKLLSASRLFQGALFLCACKDKYNSDGTSSTREVPSHFTER